MTLWYFIPWTCPKCYNIILNVWFTSLQVFPQTKFFSNSKTLPHNLIGRFPDTNSFPSLIIGFTTLFSLWLDPSLTHGDESPHKIHFTEKIKICKIFNKLFFYNFYGKYVQFLYGSIEIIQYDPNVLPIEESSPWALLIVVDLCIEIQQTQCCCSSKNADFLPKPFYLRPLSRLPTKIPLSDTLIFYSGCNSLDQFFAILLVYTQQGHHYLILGILQVLLDQRIFHGIGWVRSIPLQHVI